MSPSALHPAKAAARPEYTQPDPAGSEPAQSPLNLIVFSLSVGALVLAAVTLSAPSVLVIPIVVVCLTLSLLGAATKQSFALLGWVGAVLCAVALTLGIIAAVSG